MTDKKRGTRVKVKSFEGSLCARPVDGFARVSVVVNGKKSPFRCILPVELLEYPND